MERKIQDKDLGTIILRTSERARRYTLKISGGHIIAVMPLRGSESSMLNFIEEKRTSLIKALQKHPATPKFDESSELITQTFRLHIFRTDRRNFYLTLHDGILHIACPLSIDFEEEKIQNILRDMIGKALRHEANKMLPKRLKELAEQYNFTYTDVKITKSKSNWGSCSVRKSINLSRSLMLLPRHLSDYVLLHELCHTIEMSHNERFWALMDKVTNNQAKALRKELKSYHSFE